MKDDDEAEDEESKGNEWKARAFVLNRDVHWLDT